ncbi:MAG: 23S rRNA (adenine(2503)-C(2))-methyltransferase RlmN [Christensenellaceae bacterium]|jgi:23S rRNA (adenine2503-C2)-methyltransferase|nr:23S rRNA (adenine(2503)-C(2))-methyltransferase RlmN [Christensenellaceae bacterium]
MKYIYDLMPEELNLNPGYRNQQVWNALQDGKTIDEITNIPNSLKNELKLEYDCNLPRIVNELQSKDGTRKFLLEFADRSLIECVLLQQDYGNTICVSTQVGCRMGCKFCASGADGIVRDLTCGEILAQVILVNKIQHVTNIVLMGSGEPFDNYDNVVKFFRLVNSAGGLNISMRNISVSTCGIVPKIKDFADLQIGVNLCVSLHAPNDTVRRRIMPIANRYSVSQILDAARYFFDKTHRRVIFEYSLIAGINDKIEHAKELSKLIKGFPNHVNLILVNTFNNEFRQDKSSAMVFMDTLIKNGTSCTMRRSRGGDIDGACGQLRLRSMHTHD